MNRTALTLGGVVLVGTGMGLAYLQRAPGVADVGPARNLVVISIDTLRADHLSGYGYDRQTSPRLDAFAATGSTFINAVSSSSWTVPAHVTLFTGLEPVAHGMIDYPDVGRLGSYGITLAETLKRNGFRTAAFTGGGFVSDRHGFENGFDVFVSNGRRFEDNLPVAETWLDSLGPAEPFFMFLHGFNTHKPFKPPAPYDRTFCPDYKGSYDTADFQPENPRPSPEDLDYVICQYDGEIAYVDELLGGFLEGLRDRGLLDDTLVVITSDHGDEMYDHGMVDHIHTLYDELVRVPLMMVGPGVGSRVIRRQVGLIDVFATVCELLEVEEVPAGQGRSLVPLMRGEVGLDSDPSAADEATAVYSFTGFSEYPYHLSSVRTSRWKLVAWSLAGMSEVRLGGGPNHIKLNLTVRPERERYTYKFRDRAEDFVELFDLVADPGEQHNVAAEHGDVVRRLAAMLERRIADSRSFAREPDRAPRPDAAYLEALWSLGYVTGPSEPASQPAEQAASQPAD